MTDHFAEKSRDWDERPGPVQISEAVGRLLAELDWDASMRVLDFGAGTGLVAAHVAPYVAKVVAADVSPSMLEAIAARFAEHLKPGGILALADLDREDGTFHSPDTEGVFHRGFDRAALQSTLEAQGFEAVRFTTALELEKEGRGKFPVFFVTARKA